MRVYKFLSARYGLEALKKRRLKISRINELNDPFEFLGAKLSNHELRRALKTVKNRLDETRGLLCFSKRWKNPVLWSHYAEAHRGVCLAFDVPDDRLVSVQYTRKRPDPLAFFTADKAAQEREMKGLLCRKFCHWRYESEARLFVGLEKIDAESGLYFLDFSDALALKQVFAGAESNVSRTDVAEALGDGYAHVERIKTRAAFQTFNVVRNRNQSMWS